LRHLQRGEREKGVRLGMLYKYRNIPSLTRFPDRTAMSSTSKVQEIEITPEMLERGVQSYMTCGIDPEQDIELFLATVYRAMLAPPSQDGGRIRPLS
jgi:hypothetical protein